MQCLTTSTKGNPRSKMLTERSPTSNAILNHLDQGKHNKQNVNRKVAHLKRDPDSGVPRQGRGIALPGEPVLQRAIGTVLVDRTALLGAAAHEHHNVGVAERAQNFHLPLELVRAL
jgi:hypothetical protein